MSGRPGTKRLAGRLKRLNFTLLTTIAGLVVVSIISFTIYDFVKTAQAKDQQVLESSLRGQLAEFLLGSREPDGTSLLENPSDFSRASRPLQVVSLRRSFFGYLLNTGNSRTFKVADLTWDPPRACVVEFRQVGDRPTSALHLQACFAAIRGDPTGRYVYFSLRYPTSKIRRYSLGQTLKEAHQVVFTFAGQREVKLNVVYQLPPLASSRYPSQLARFEGLHELTAFASEDPGRATRALVGQAFERVAEAVGGEAKNYITLVGRIDSSILPIGATDAGQWPQRQVHGLSIGVEVRDFDEQVGQTRSMITVSPGEMGVPLVSLAQAYLAAVPSRANLVITAAGTEQAREVVWRSADAGLAEESRLTGWSQRISDWWTSKLVAWLGVSGQRVSAQQSVYVAGRSQTIATLTAEPALLPDIATRAFAGLSIALVLVIALCVHWTYALIRLRRITGSAYAMIAKSRSSDTLKPYAARKDEIGTLGRALHLLIARSRSRSVNVTKRLRQEEILRLEGVRLAEARVQARQAILDAIGHEIRSPLQSILNRTLDKPELQNELQRMRRAVEALYMATSVEAGLRGGEIIIRRQDLAEYLNKLAKNLKDDGKEITYVGPATGLEADFDPLSLESILDNLIENAFRYRRAKTLVELRLESRADGIALEVFNQGPLIPSAELESIFDYGVSDAASPENSGLGLFASRHYALAMRATIRAENQSNGVAMVITFPPTTATRA
ncbi:sensor histidine kinase [Methylibium petroleiphilum]|uniref:sensor histidine kinase n=1 Tax=Methylibium petroleiphilum TaxID=105560 RepID=UPI003D2A68A4